MCQTAQKSIYLNGGSKKRQIKKAGKPAFNTFIVLIIMAKRPGFYTKQQFY